MTCVRVCRCSAFSLLEPICKLRTIAGSGMPTTYLELFQPTRSSCFLIALEASMPVDWSKSPLMRPPDASPQSARADSAGNGTCPSPYRAVYIYSKSLSSYVQLRVEAVESRELVGSVKPPLARDRTNVSFMTPYQIGCLGRT